jgi:hypothetical protein
VICVFLLCVSVGLSAQSEGAVGLGVFLGVAFPQGSSAAVPSTDWMPSFNWGYYVNIPLIATFHLSPSSELYKLGDANATDFSIAFKFIIPLSGLSLYMGFVPGLTSVSEALDIHVGALGGFSLNLVSNLDVFAQVKYVFIFEGNQNIRVLHANAGILFNF